MCKSNTRFKKGLIWYTMYKKVEQKKLFINQNQLIPNRDPNNHNTPEVCPIFYLLSHSNFECRFSQNVKKRHQFKKKTQKTDSLSTSYNQHFHYPIQTWKSMREANVRYSIFKYHYITQVNQILVVSSVGIYQLTLSLCAEFCHLSF